MAMKCPNCGREVAEDKKFCGDCGAMIPPPMYAPVQRQPIPPKQDWLGTNWKALASVFVVLIIISVSMGLIYTQEWSKIKVIVSHSEYSQIRVDVYIDGILKASVGVNPGTTIVGVWPVSAGTHTVQIDRGNWYFVDRLLFSDYWAYDSPDGYIDFTYAYEVGPLYTKNVYITLS
jgi:hypothetical protein